MKCVQIDCDMTFMVSGICNGYVVYKMSRLCTIIAKNKYIYTI